MKLYSQLRSRAKSIITLGAASLLVFGCAAAEDAERESVAAFKAAIETAKATEGLGHPAMWSLKDDDTTIYILGTIHLLKPDTQWRTDAINSAFEAADKLVLEADATSAEAQQKMTSIVFSTGVFTDGSTLSDLLDEEQEASVREALSSVGLQLEVINPFKPWFANLNVSVTQMTNAGFDPNAGVETVLTAEAETAGKSFGYLETIEDQMAIFSSDPIDEQVEAFLAGMELLELGPVALETLANEWADGDTAGLTAVVGSPDIFEETDDYEALLVDRNANWVPQIISMLDEPGTVFVAVGAGHLVGEDSVIAMLENEGFTVEGPF